MTIVFRASRKRPYPSERPQPDQQIEDANLSMLVLRHHQTAENPIGDVIQLKCLSEDRLNQARSIMATVAPHVQLPDPSSYDNLQGDEKKRALREEWRTIFSYYLQHQTVDTRPVQVEAPASSALLSSHQRLVVPQDLTVGSNDEAGSLLFLKRFRLNKSTLQLTRPQLPINKQYEDFLIIDDGLAKRSDEIFQCMVNIYHSDHF